MQPNLDYSVGMSENKAYCIALDSLELGEHVYDFHLSSDYFAAIDRSELLGGEVQVQARLKLRQYDFDLTIAVKGLVQVTCDRCLDAMDIAIQAEESEWDWDQEPKHIDLSWLAYELIIVNLPLVHSHHEGGCNPEMDALLQDHLCTEVDEEE